MEIGVQETKALLAADPSVCLVDCREEHEYAYCHIPGAKLVPLSNFRTEAAAQLQDRQQTIVVYCHHGMRSLKATAYLQQLGYSHVRSLAGGIDQWSLQVDPTIPRY